MPTSETSSSSSITQAIRDAIVVRLPGAIVKARGAERHYTIEVVWAGFDGLRTVEKQRLVYSAITELMSGPDPPVHAVDQLETRLP